MDIKKRIGEFLGEYFANGPLSDCFLIEIVQNSPKSLTVYFDSDSGVTFEKCTQVSRYLEKRMDEAHLLGGDYVLDVSSPGVDRPLMFWRQYPRHKGRRLVVTLKDGSKREGVLASVGWDGISLETDKKESELIPFAEIEKSFVQISF
jgi:ribosome maturation factor RimP